MHYILFVSDYCVTIAKDAVACIFIILFCYSFHSFRFVEWRNPFRTLDRLSYILSLLAVSASFCREILEKRLEIGYDSLLSNPHVFTLHAYLPLLFNGI
jgi:hypothetical protein